MLLAILRRDFVPRHASLRALEYLRGRHINLEYAGTIAALEMILPGTSIPSILVDSRLNPLMMARMVSQGPLFSRRFSCYKPLRSSNLHPAGLEPATL
jgi:hypothetical protein